MSPSEAEALSPKEYLLALDRVVRSLRAHLDLVEAAALACRKQYDTMKRTVGVREDDAACLMVPVRERLRPLSLTANVFAEQIDARVKDPFGREAGCSNCGEPCPGDFCCPHCENQYKGECCPRGCNYCEDNL